MHAKWESIHDDVGKLQKAHGLHDVHHAALQERVGYLDGLLSDTATKHDQLESQAHEALTNRTALLDRVAALQERVDNFDGGDSLDKCKKLESQAHDAALLERLEYIE